MGGAERDQAGAEADRLQQEHLRHLFTLRNEGKLLLNGPVLDESELVGIAIYAGQDRDVVRALAEADPSVKAGRLRVDVRPLFGIPGRTQYGPRARSDPGDLAGPRLEHDHGDGPVGLLLVLVVRRPTSTARAHQAAFSSPSTSRRAEGADVGAVLDGDVGVGEQVQVPAGMVGGPALRGNRGIASLVFDAHDRRLADLAGAATPHRDDHARRALDVSPLVPPDDS